MYRTYKNQHYIIPLSISELLVLVIIFCIKSIKQGTLTSKYSGHKIQCCTQQNPDSSKNNTLIVLPIMDVFRTSMSQCKYCYVTTRTDC